MRPSGTTVSVDTGRLSLPAVLVHGGAGTFERIGTEADAGELSRGLEAALGAAWEVLTEGGTALGAAVEAVASLEDSGRFNAGRGSVATSSGTYEFDAGVMDGTTGKVGAVCATTYPANPVRVAARVADIGGAPDGPLLLAGAGADRFAEEAGFDKMVLGTAATGAEGQRHADSPSAAGTVGAVAVDAEGNIAAATSTGGRAGQLPGRVGDSPIPGAGVWADASTAAVSATGAGEAFVIAGFGHRVDWEMRSGAALAEALEAALAVVAQLGGTGGAIAVTAEGLYVAGFNSRAMARAWRDAAGAVSRLFPA